MGFPAALGWAGLGVKAFGGLLSDFLSSRNNSKMIKAQREENALTREFNAAEAQKSRDFALDMFNRENSYNDPRSVITRLQRAGVNPALAYGGFANSAAGSVPNPAFSGGAISPMSMDYSGIRSASNSINETLLAESQARLNDAEARKLDKETGWVDTLKSLDAQLKTEGLNLAKLLPQAKLKEMEFTEANTEESKQRAEHLKVVMEDIQKNWKLLEGKIEEQDLKNANLEIALKYADEKQRVEIQQMISEVQRNFADADLTRKQAYLLGQTMIYEITKAKYEASITESEHYIKHSEGYQSWLDEKTARRVFAKHGIELSEKQWQQIIYATDALKRQAYGNGLDFLNILFKAAIGAGMLIK